MLVFVASTMLEGIQNLPESKWGREVDEISTLLNA